ncbi:Probable carboxyvinyl-carboxyphosphonate phosphorylmutase; possible methylisocitrate lyase (PrpB) [Mycobacteroides abscessus subsp. abscessus]|nr:Probable carboxyvinyl-carboxyphosphonate phosphorylmutase; possible methylisocitrate lyase (PrpB) [Mycobacteroides abscessus subsp. abscessus]
MSTLLASATDAATKRAAFRQGLSSGELLRLPGAFSPLVAKLIQEIGFEGVYVSGAVLSADLALPDIGLTTLTEVSARGRQIASVTDLPTLIDADTGFGEPMSAARTVAVLEDSGVAGLHLEDQVNPKRCGHLDGKAVVETAEMVRRLHAAVSARRDPNFVICARTDAAGIEGLPAAIDRARAYADAGADLIFTEALTDIGEFEKFRAAVDIPLLANMTEFGKSELVTADRLREVGYNVVIYPVTTLRLAMYAVEQGLHEINSAGTQSGLLEQMQHRSRLYELLHYAEYNRFDTEIFNLPGETHGELLWRDKLVWAGRPNTHDVRDPVPVVTYPPPSLTRHAALRALEREGRTWRIACVSDSQLGLRAAALAGMGVIAHAESLLPSGLVKVSDDSLPDLGELEFVLLRRRSVLSEPEQALCDAIVASTHRLHGDFGFTKGAGAGH